jgi:hypothetical protein
MKEKPFWRHLLLFKIRCHKKVEFSPAKESIAIVTLKCMK